MIESKTNATEQFQSMSTLHQSIVVEQPKPVSYEQDYFLSLSIATDSEQPDVFSQNAITLIYLGLASFALFSVACILSPQLNSLMCVECHHQFEQVPDPDTFELVEVRHLLHDHPVIPRDVL